MDNNRFAALGLLEDNQSLSPLADPPSELLDATTLWSQPGSKGASLSKKERRREWKARQKVAALGLLRDKQSLTPLVDSLLLSDTTPLRLQPNAKAASSSKKKRRQSQKISRKLWPSGEKGKTSPLTLCNVCKSIFNKKRDIHVLYQHHKQHSSLESAAQSLCYICCSLWYKVIALGIQILPAGHATPSIRTGLYYKFYTYKIPDLLLIFEHEDGHKLPTELLKLTMHLSADELETFLTKDSIGKSTLSKESLDLARRWLQDCRSNHQCETIRPIDYLLPTRLLCTGTKHEICRLRLCEGADLPPSTSYLTLSHCWGKHQTFSLQLDNEDHLKQEIELEKLPKVYQDAIFITRELGFEFLWIDSLCILQNSTQDWLQEAGRMASTYQNAVCNIAATGFEDGSSGLFVSRTEDLLLPLKVFANLGVFRGRYLIEENWWNTGIDEAPLNLRAWVLQERILSPRILHFGARQLFWECDKTCNEVYPKGIPMDMEVDTRESLKALWSSLACYPERNWPRSDATFWEYLVTVYSGKTLTYPKDKLAALSGIARELELRSGNQYLAGLWKENLPRQLLWCVLEPGYVDMSLEYGIPTWSWASVDEKVYFGFACEQGGGVNITTETIHSTFLERQTVFFNNEQTGVVTGGHLCIKGPLREARKQINANLGCTEPKWILGGETINACFFPDIKTQKDHHDQFQPHTALRPSNMNGFPGQCGRSVSLSDQYASFFFLPIRSIEENDAEKTFRMYGIVLIPSGSKGQFQRVGVFEVKDRQGRDSILRPMTTINEQYHKTFDEDQYTISIV